MAGHEYEQVVECTGLGCIPVPGYIVNPVTYPVVEENSFVGHKI